MSTHLASLLRMHRLRAGLNQSQLSRLIGCDPASGRSVVKLHEARQAIATPDGLYTTTPAKEIVMPRQYTRIPLADRFWPKVDRNGPIPSHIPDLALPPCWLWTATIMPNGYGQTSVDGNRHEYAHRAAWTLVAGPIPEGQGIYHICDTPACVRNDEMGVYIVNGIALPRYGHLFMGTPTHNNADRVAKGRTVPRTDWTPARGERNGQAKLTEAQVHEIRARYVPRRVTLATLGSEYGVSESAIHMIVRRKNWQV